jgi:hypothetical protein
MTPTPADTTTTRWFAAFTLALVIQSAAFGYWAGSLNASVTALTGAVAQLRQDVAAHINAR